MPRGITSVVEWAKPDDEPKEKTEAGADSACNSSDEMPDVNEFPVTSRSVMLCGVNEDDEDKLREWLEDYFKCQDFDLHITHDGSYVEVVMNFPDVSSKFAWICCKH